MLVEEILYEYRKKLYQAPWGFLILDTREGGLFKKLDEEDTYGGFISLLLHILLLQDAILPVKCINLTDLNPKL